MLQASVPNISSIFKMYVASVFVWMLHMFHTYVASVLFRGKSLLHPPTMGSGLLYPQTKKRSNLPPELCKTGQITPSSGFRRWFCYSINGFAIVTAVLSFSFLFISSESLKNHSKSQKNYKIENPILLAST
jgi:hypothetical protein